MRLPDFLVDLDLNNLRKAMGAELGAYTPAPLTILTLEEIEQLQTEGIEIPLEDVKVLNDGTYVYKGRRVVVHIRDVEEYGDRYSLPRFHLAMCSTLGQMIEHGRYQKRYVVSTRDDGRFRIHRIRNGNITKLEEPLNVCQNCLEELHYEHFSLQMTASKRKMAVQKFSLKTFFDEFDRTCVWATPKYDDKNAPPNVYSVHFYRIARAIKEQRGYRCENPACRLDLSHPDDHRFLHAHHIDADKSDSQSSNIRLLCIGCHADQFKHSHLRDSPDYAQFISKFGRAKKKY
jgi:hypothetical protein